MNAGYPLSGSLIIQDVKLLGAVLHVLLKGAGKGIGISIETMLNATESEKDRGKPLSFCR